LLTGIGSLYLIIATELYRCRWGMFTRNRTFARFFVTLCIVVWLTLLILALAAAAVWLPQASYECDILYTVAFLDVCTCLVLNGLALVVILCIATRELCDYFCPNEERRPLLSARLSATVPFPSLFSVYRLFGRRRASGDGDGNRDTAPLTAIEATASAPATANAPATATAAAAATAAASDATELPVGT